MKKRGFIITIIAIGLVSAACGGPDLTPTIVPTDIPKTKVPAQVATPTSAAPFATSPAPPAPPETTRIPGFSHTSVTDVSSNSNTAGSHSLAHADAYCKPNGWTYKYTYGYSYRHADSHTTQAGQATGANCGLATTGPYSSIRGKTIPGLLGAWVKKFYCR